MFISNEICDTIERIKLRERKRFDKNMSLYVCKYFTINCDIFLSNKNIYSIYLN